jgi:hypothetical protein
MLNDPLFAVAFFLCRQNDFLNPLKKNKNPQKKTSKKCLAILRPLGTYLDSSFLGTASISS